MRKPIRVVLLAGVGLFGSISVDFLTTIAPVWIWPTAVFACLCGVALTYVPEIRAWLRRRVFGPKVVSGNAMPATFNFHVPPASGTSCPPSVFARLKRQLRRIVGIASPSKTPMYGIAEIERCHAELVKHIDSQPPDPISFKHVALSHALLPHIETVHRILDKQRIPHPDIELNLIFEGVQEWGMFLARLMAAKDDVEEARLIYGGTNR